MKTSLVFAFLLFPLALFAQVDFKDPPGFVRIAETQGDLDRDKVDEAVIVYNSGKETDEGQLREVYVLKIKNKAYVPWFIGKAVVLGSMQGGGWGDPFADLQIKNSQLIVSHYGGGTAKWAYSHYFEVLKGRLILVNVEISRFSYENELAEFTYNLLTGQVRGQIESEDQSQKDRVFDFKQVPNDKTDFASFRVLQNKLRLAGEGPDNYLVY